MPQINCFIPIKVTVRGRPGPEQIEALSAALMRALETRLSATAERTATAAGGRAGEVEVVRSPWDPRRWDAEATGYRLPSYDANGELTTVPLSGTAGASRSGIADGEGPPRTFGSCMALLHRAQALALAAPPDLRAAERIVLGVQAWLRRLVTSRNIDDHFFLRGFNLTAADLLCRNALSAADDLARDLRRRERFATSRGIWRLRLGHVWAARDYLLILNDELAYEASGTAQAVEKWGYITGGVGIAILAAPALVAGGAAAAPLIASEASLFAGWAVGLARSAWLLAITHPIEAIVLTEFGFGALLQIVASGGLREYLQALQTPQGFVLLTFELLILRMQVRTPGGRIRTVEIETEVVSATPTTVTLKVKTPAAPVVDPPSASAPASAPAAALAPATTATPPAMAQPPVAPNAVPSTALPPAPLAGAGPPATPRRTYSTTTGRYRKVGDPVVEEAPPGRAPRESLKPGADTASQLDEAAAAQQRATDTWADLPRRRQKKTVAAGGQGAPRISGWVHIPESDLQANPQAVAGHGKRIGHPSRRHVHDPKGSEGHYYASHAEKQQIVAQPNRPVGVQRPMCEDCISFFKREAAYRARPQVVSDPECTRVFDPNGTVTEYWKDGSVLRLGPDGTARADPRP